MSAQGVTLNFDATQIDPRQSKGGVCFPLAEYPCEIVEIDAVAVKDNPNKGFLEVTLRVLDGQYKGQDQIDRLNMYGQKEDVSRIAMQRLSAYAHIAGKPRVGNSNELIGTKVIALIGPQDAPNDKYSEVKQLKDLAGNVPVWNQASAPQNTPIAAVQQPTQPTQPAFGQQQQQTTQPTFTNPAQTQQQPANAGWATGPAATAAATGGNPPWVKP